MAKVITGETFEAEVLKSNVPVVVDFFATWCGPCRMVAPVLEELSEELAGKVKIVKIDIDKEANWELSDRYEIVSVPTLLMFKNGVMADKVVGALPKAMLQPRVEALL